jgi:hypothetical protein
MEQAVHIFWKDIRRCWREITISVVLLIIYGWNEVHGWRRGEDWGMGIGLAGVFSVRFLHGMVVALIPAAWAFSIVRIVQDESPVGDRQFWITRPYVWPKLLAAKALFFVTFINTPLLVLDVFLLTRAGFPASHYVVPLLWMQLLISVFFILPVAALASVTRSIAQMLLAVLAFIIYMVGVGTLSTLIPSSNFSDPVDSLIPALLILTSATVAILQYARRDTRRSRWLFGALAGTVVLIVVATPYGWIVAHRFPKLGADNDAPFHIALANKPLEPEYASDPKKTAGIRVPLDISGVPPESIVAITGMLVHIESPNGLKWSSGWNSPGLTFYPETKTAQIAFSLKKNTFDGMKSGPVNISLRLAFTLFHDANQRTLMVPPGEFPIQAAGMCFPFRDYSPAIRCVVPFRRPSSLLVSADASQSTCPASREDPRPYPRKIVRDWTSNSDSQPAEFGISPIQVFDIRLYDWSASGLQSSGGGLCPGTPIVLSNPEAVSSHQVAFQFTGLNLSDYHLKPLAFSYTVLFPNLNRPRIFARRTGGIPSAKIAKMFLQNLGSCDNREWQ